MSGLRLHLESASHYECIEGVTSFVAEDASGSFGILPRHEAFITVTEFGLSRYRVGTGPWRYIAAPGAVIRHEGKELHFSTRHYVLGDDYTQICAVLRKQLADEERSLEVMRQSVRDLESQMLKRLWQLGRRDGAVS
jgi:F-type H+-transporting ATPase subunit epsilon